MIQVNKIIPQTVEAFDSEGNSLGMLNEYEFNDLRLQICAHQQEGYYLMFNNIKISIDKYGDCDRYPSEFFSLLDTQLGNISKMRRKISFTKRYNVGDKLEALSLDKEEYGIDYVTITSINEENQVYHWESKNPYGFGGKVCSGYYFADSKLYKSE